MPIPDKIPIQHFENYRTHDIGKYGGGNQFMGFVVATLPETFDDWQRHKRWYAVLHTFDVDGNHLHTEARFAGVTADGEQQVVDRAAGWLDEMLEGLGKIERGDVVIRRFSVEVDGRIFGLIDYSHLDMEDELKEELVLAPCDLFFYAPWDGDFDT